MDTQIILEEKDIKRAIVEYLIGQGHAGVRAIYLHYADHPMSADPREYSNFYAEVELEVDSSTLETVEPA